MKRCPQCEFIYEDEQSVCDMDGKSLVFDSRPLPNFQKLVAEPAQLPARTDFKYWAVPALAAVVLAVILGLVYFVSTQRLRAVATGATTTAAVETSSALPDQQPPSNVSSPELSPNTESVLTTGAAQSAGPDTASEKNQVEVAAPVKIDESTIPSSTERKREKPENNSRSRKNQKRISLNSNPVDSRRSSKAEPAKKESKVTAFFKKTGRLLKKPFRM